MFGNSVLKKAFLPVFLVLLLLVLQVSAEVSHLLGGPGSGEFGRIVVLHSSGNTIVVDPHWNGGPGLENAGKVSVFSGKTGHLLSELTGDHANDQLGSGGISTFKDAVLVSSPHWNGERGAFTKVNPVEGLNGTPNGQNSSLGNTPGDGSHQNAEFYFNIGIIFTRPEYDKPSSPLTESIGAIVNVGAVTFCSLTEPCVGVISEQNSLIGTSAGDQVGTVTPLANGDYVVSSPSWDNSSSGTANVGAVTRCNGTTGCVGEVTAGNSLIGVTANDRVGGTGVTALSDGGYVVKSTGWHNPSPLMADVGAATYCSASALCTGPVTASNSLVGGTANDFVGNGVIALNDGNYVVSSPVWDSPSPSLQDAGAATFCSSTSPCTGMVTSSNSLVGSTAFENLGNFGVTALSNGNYVVATPQWDNPAPLRTDAGAATFCTAAAPCTGAITAANSLIGGRAFDQVASGRVTALTGGNYVVGSPSWANTAPLRTEAGAATWGNGTTGAIGLITSTNSLVGGASGNNVGSGVTLLANGNYVVRSPFWDNPAPATQDVGAVTWCAASGSTVGTVTETNSLIGGRPFDNAGITGVTALANGNYVVGSRLWDNPAPVTSNVGAVTWGNGGGGTVGPITALNSLVGSAASDEAGSGGTTALPGGNYAVTSPLWDNPSPVVANASAVSFGNGVSGTAGPISDANSVLGTVAAGTNTFSYDELRNRLFVGRAASNIVSILFFNTTAITDGSFNSAATWNNGVPNGYTNGDIPNGRTVTLTSPTTVGLVSVGCSGAIAGGSPTAFINGSVEKDYCLPTGNDERAAGGQSFTYPLGDGGNYSPVAASNVGGNGSLLVTVTDATLPGLYAPQSASRHWTLSGAGITADLAFTYVDADVNGTEADYKVFKRSGGAPTQVTPFSLNAGTNTITVTSMTGLSADWGVGNLAPALVAGVSISGAVRTADGRGITNAIVTLSGGDLAEALVVLTRRNGMFSFHDIPVGRTYILTVRSRRFAFKPDSRVFTLTDELGGQDFTGLTGTEDRLTRRE